MSLEDHIAWVPPRFEDVASEEQLEAVERSKEEQHHKRMINKDKYKYRDEAAKKCDSKMLDIADGEIDGEIPLPKPEDIRNETRAQWIGPNMAVSVTRDPYKTPHRTDGVGSRPIKPDNNILQNYEARTIKNKDIKQLDKETSDENMKKWRNEEMYIPFVDPSTDSLQDNVREVCVKITGVGKDTEGDVDDTNNWLLDKMSSLETRIHYYSFKPSVDLRKLIFEQDIDAVFGGSDGVPEDYQVILSTKRFRITALDISGGTSSHISDFYECIEPLSTDDNCLIECFKYLSGSNEDCQEIRRKLSIKSEGLLGNKNIPKLEEYFNLEVCVRLDEFNVENEDGANFFTPRIIYGDEDCESWLLLKDSHYSIILEEKIYDIVKTAKTKEPDVEKNRHSKTLYYFFDYETVWDP
ncbi:hypothetical protein EV178_006459, partial [Coemansia sp. RSA 1646]